MASENVTYTADVTSFLRGIAACESAQKELRRDMKATAIAATAGSKEAAQAYLNQARSLHDLSTQKRRFTDSLRSAIHGNNEFSGSMGRTNFAINQGIFAIDDFVTVVGQQGFAGGIRAAGNNLSALAMQFGPVAGIATIAATALGSFVAKTLEAESSSKKLEDQLKRTTDAQKAFADVTKQMQGKVDAAFKTPEEIEKGEDDAKINETKGKLTSELASVQSQLPKLREQAKVFRQEADKIAKEQGVDEGMGGIVGGTISNVIDSTFFGGFQTRRRQLVEKARKIEDMISPLQFREAELKGQIGDVDKLQGNLNRARDAEAFLKMAPDIAPQLMNDAMFPRQAPKPHPEQAKEKDVKELQSAVVGAIKDLANQLMGAANKELNLNRQANVE